MDKVDSVLREQLVRKLEKQQAAAEVTRRLLALLDAEQLDALSPPKKK